MVVVGADVHKQTHTFVGIDEAGRELGHKTFPAVTEGHRAAVRWARKTFGAELRWAVEDCRHLSARLERDLLTDGQTVVRVPPKMMAVLVWAAQDRQDARQVRPHRRGCGGAGRLARTRPACRLPR